MIYAILAYVAAMAAANFIVAYVGPWTIPINAFLLIGLDLALRDWLHFRLGRWQMAWLVISSGALTYALSPEIAHVALASSVAFTAAAAVDWAVFSAVRGPWVRRSTASNVAGAAVDSVIFPWMVYHGLDPAIVLTMFGAKVAGAAMWTWFLSRTYKLAA